MTPAGRRPGHVDTKGTIVEAARAEFAEHGYEKTSLRGIARRAGVDPALVHHYFDDKAALFVTAAQLPVDPRAVQVESQAPTTMGRGEMVVERFLAQWEEGHDEPGSPSFVALAQAMSSSRETADTMREFLAERIKLFRRPGESEEMSKRRRSLVSSQLLGLAWNRYLMRMEPLASARREDVARWVGPTIERYMNEELDS